MATMIPSLWYVWPIVPNPEKERERVPAVFPTGVAVSCLICVVHAKVSDTPMHHITHANVSCYTHAQVM